MNSQKHSRGGSSFKRLFGALASRHPAVPFALFIKLVTPITHLLDGFAAVPPEIKSEKLRCLFLVCPPRAGGTVVFQSLTSALPSIYPMNLHALFPRLGTKLYRHLRLKPQTNFSSYNGYTIGLNGVYEANELLDWAHANLDLEQMRERFVHLVSDLNPQDSEVVVLKNARFFANIYALHQAVPEIIWVRVQRNPQQVIESALRAYYETGNFHPIPEGLSLNPEDDPLLFAVGQILGIERCLDEQFSKIDAASKYTIQYEAFCANPFRDIEMIVEQHLKIDKSCIHHVKELEEISSSQRQRVPQADVDRIQALLAERNRDWFR